MKARFSLLLSVFLICAPVALHAEIDPSEAAEAAILELEAAATALANAESASDRIAALTQTIRGYEHGLLNLCEAVRRFYKGQSNRVWILRAPNYQGC